MDHFEQAMRKAIDDIHSACKKFKDKIAERGLKVTEASPRSDGKTTTSFKELSKEYFYGSRFYAVLEDRLADVESDLKSEWKGSISRKHNFTEKNSSLQGVTDYYQKGRSNWLKAMQADLKKSEEKISKDHNWGQVQATKQGEVNKCIGVTKAFDDTMKGVKENLRDPYVDLLKSLKSDRAAIQTKSIIMKRNSDIAKIEEEKQGVVAARSSVTSGADPLAQKNKPAVKVNAPQERNLASNTDPTQVIDNKAIPIENNSGKKATSLGGGAMFDSFSNAPIVDDNKTDPEDTKIEQLLIKEIRGSKEVPGYKNEGGSKEAGGFTEVGGFSEVELDERPNSSLLKEKEKGQDIEILPDEEKSEKTAVVADQPNEAKEETKEKAVPEKTTSAPPKQIKRNDVKNYLDNFDPSKMGSEQAKQITNSDTWYNLKRKHQSVSASQRQSRMVNCSKCHD